MSLIIIIWIIYGVVNFWACIFIKDLKKYIAFSLVAGFLTLGITISVNVTSQTHKTVHSQTKYLKVNNDGHTQYSTHSSGLNKTVYTVQTTNGNEINLSNPTVVYNSSNTSKAEITKTKEKKTFLGLETDSKTYTKSTIYIIK